MWCIQSVCNIVFEFYFYKCEKVENVGTPNCVTLYMVFEVLTLNFGATYLFISV